MGLLIGRRSAWNQLVDMPIICTQPARQHLGPPQPNRSSLNVNQQPRTIKGRQHREVFQSAIGHQQQSLSLRRETLLTSGQPASRLTQRCQQGRAAAGSEAIQPGTQTGGRLQPLHLPFRYMTAGGQQGQARALAVGVIEQLCQQPLGIAQRLMTPSRGRGIDDHQPQFMGGTGAQVKQHIVALPGAATQQRAGPIDRAVARGVTLALPAIVQPSGAGPGIRPRVGSRANA